MRDEKEVRAETVMTIITDAFSHLISCEAVMTELDGQEERKGSVIDSTRGIQHVLEERLREITERLHSLDERMVNFKDAIDS